MGVEFAEGLFGSGDGDVDGVDGDARLVEAGGAPAGQLHSAVATHVGAAGVIEGADAEDVRVGRAQHDTWPVLAGDVVAFLWESGKLPKPPAQSVFLAVSRC